MVAFPLVSAPVDPESTLVFDPDTVSRLSHVEVYIIPKHESIGIIPITAFFFYSYFLVDSSNWLSSLRKRFGLHWTRTVC